MIRVLVVDDSASMRALLKRAAISEPGIEVVGEAANTAEAREKIKQLDPDVVTLDVEMPGMNGLEFLGKLMRLRPTPVIMVSNLTAPGAAATIEALATGAFECIAKPNGVQGNTFAALPNLLRNAAAARKNIQQRSWSAPTAPRKTGAEGSGSWPEIVGLGASTGGVEALLQILAEFPENCPPTLIVQHLPAAFTKSFAARLDRGSAPKVAEAEDGEPLKQGRVYLAPGGKHLTVVRSGGLHCRLTSQDPVQGHRPSVDVMFESMAATAKGRVCAALMTGMGQDGAQGLLALRKMGARTIAQDQETSLVYGMPRAAYEIGAVEVQAPLSHIARKIFSGGDGHSQGASDRRYSASSSLHSAHPPRRPAEGG